jgi:hypothetical protein
MSERKGSRDKQKRRRKLSLLPLPIYKVGVYVLLDEKLHDIDY